MTAYDESDNDDDWLLNESLNKLQLHISLHNYLNLSKMYIIKLNDFQSLKPWLYIKI